jgi:hypothetical protein
MEKVGSNLTIPSICSYFPSLGWNGPPTRAGARADNARASTKTKAANAFVPVRAGHLPGVSAPGETSACSLSLGARAGALRRRPRCAGYGASVERGRARGGRSQSGACPGHARTKVLSRRDVAGTGAVSDTEGRDRPDAARGRWRQSTRTLRPGLDGKGGSVQRDRRSPW